MPIRHRDNSLIQPQKNLTLPWTINPNASWLDYNCWVEVELDAGMVLHKPLPQFSASVDTLATQFFQDYAPVGNPDVKAPSTGGVSIVSSSQGVDVIQRMSTSTYYFILTGYGLRVGYQIPIPGLKSVGGITAVPFGSQRAYNKIIGNMSGIPLWAAAWRIAYMLASCPQSGSITPVPPNLAARIRGDATLPSAIAVPFAPVDSIQQPQTEPEGGTPGMGAPGGETVGIQGFITRQRP